MAIADADVVMYPAAVENDTASNGGRIDDSTPIPDNVRDNLFPLRESSYLSAGGSRSRKLFWRFEDNSEYASNIKIWLGSVTQGGDRVLMREPGVSVLTETQGDLGVPTYYGAATLDAAITAGDTVIDVLLEAASDVLFRAGEEIRIDDGTNAEYATISGAPTLSGAVLTITVSAPIANSYATATPTIVSSVYTVGDRQPSAGSGTVTSAAGTFDNASVTVYPDSAIPDTITVTFTDATNFTVAGVAAGSLGSGAIGSAFSPTNPNTSLPYFSIAPAAWGGTYAGGDTVEFDINSAVFAVWLALITPASTAAVNPNTVDVVVNFESVVI